jgi:signal transduction histidine kinase
VSPTNSWVVAVDVGGEVLGVERGAPAAWVGSILHERADVPGSVREAARSVVAAALHGNGQLATSRVDAEELGAALTIVAVPAVALGRTTVEVRSLLAHAMAALDRQARALDVTLGVVVDDAVPASVHLDPEKIGWCVSALAGNAMRYVRRGTRHMPGGSVSVRAAWDAEKGQLVLLVEDDGPGIPAATLERLFKRAPGASHATGLALTVVRDIVAAHGGTLDVATSTDDADHGTTVTVRLPAATR